MAGVVLSTVDLDVFGGPAGIDLSVDFGQTGTRGSRIWAGPGSASIYLVGQDIQLYDWYINTITGIMYQYILQVGSPTWVAIMNLVLPQKTVISTTTFTSGSTTILIPLTDFTQSGSPTISQFVIRFNIENPNPVSSSFSAVIAGSNLSITIGAIEYSGGTWSNLIGSKNVHLLVSYTG